MHQGWQSRFTQTWPCKSTVIRPSHAEKLPEGQRDLAHACEAIQTVRAGKRPQTAEDLAHLFESPSTQLRPGLFLSPSLIGFHRRQGRYVSAETGHVDYPRRPGEPWEAPSRLPERAAALACLMWHRDVPVANAYRGHALGRLVTAVLVNLCWPRRLARMQTDLFCVPGASRSFRPGPRCPSPRHLLLP